MKTTHIKHTLLALFLIISVSSCDLFNFDSKEKRTLIKYNWQMISITPEIASNEFESISKLILSFSNIVYDFNDDGTYTSTINSFLSDNTETGTWSISDDNKILTLDNENMNIHQLDKTYLKISTENSFIDNEDINELETGFLTITFATVEDDEE